MNPQTILQLCKDKGCVITETLGLIVAETEPLL